MRIYIYILSTLFIFGCGGNSGNNNHSNYSFSIKERGVFNKKVELEDKIIGLYIFYFNRAPDWEGFNYWKNKAENEGYYVLKKISKEFSEHKVFISLYSEMSNLEFVKAIYKNVLGKDGDRDGIDYWTAELDSGVSRSDMVSNFVDASLSDDINSVNFPTLSGKELKEAQDRQNLILNKVEVANYFTKLFKEKSNIKNSDSIENDIAYRASIKILEDITSDRKSVIEAKEYLDSIAIKDNPMEAIINRNIDTTTTSIPIFGGGYSYPKTEAGIQEALDSGDYSYVIYELTSNRDSYNNLNNDEVNINIAGAYVGMGGYSVFDITSAMAGSNSGLNGFVSNTTKDNNALYTIEQLEEADKYYSKVINGINCSDTTTLTEEQKLACYNLGLVRLTSLSNSVKLLFGGDEEIVKSWAEGVDINSSDDLNGNGVIDSADASACAIVYASNPANVCRDGSMATYRKKVTFIKDGLSYNTTLIDVDIGNPNLGYTTFKKLVTNGATPNSAILTDGVCDINFNRTTDEPDGVTYFPCPVINNGVLMNIADSLGIASNIQNLFPTGSETRDTIESYIKNITGSPDGVITQDKLGIYLQSH